MFPRFGSTVVPFVGWEKHFRWATFSQMNQRNVTMLGGAEAGQDHRTCVVDLPSLVDSLAPLVLLERLPGVLVDRRGEVVKMWGYTGRMLGWVTAVRVSRALGL